MRPSTATTPNVSSATLTIREVMSSPVRSVHPDTPLHEVKYIFNQGRMHHLPVMDSGQLVGMVSSTDITRIEANIANTLEVEGWEEFLSRLNVREVMTTELITVEANDDWHTAAKLFEEHRFHALPVMENGFLVGILSQFDLFYYQL